MAVSLWLIAPYIAAQSAADLLGGHRVDATQGGIVLTAVALLEMPVLGHTKHKLGQRLGSQATSGEGTQNYLCGAQAAAVLAVLAVTAVWPGAWWLDPAVGVGMALVAAREGLRAWHGEECGCWPVASWMDGRATRDCAGDPRRSDLGADERAGCRADRDAAAQALVAATHRAGTALVRDAQRSRQSSRPTCGGPWMGWGSSRRPRHGRALGKAIPVEPGIETRRPPRRRQRYAARAMLRPGHAGGPG